MNTAIKASSKLSNAQTRLERHVQRWLNDKGADYGDGWKGALKDLSYGGCQSGIVGHLIYHSDTIAFFKAHKAEINTMLKDSLESTGLSVNELFGDKWDAEDPLAMETANQNLLAWFGFEETARTLADRAGVEV